jgi:hypothetical protein
MHRSYSLQIRKRKLIKTEKHFQMKVLFFVFKFIKAIYNSLFEYEFIESFWLILILYYLIINRLL